MHQAVYLPSPYAIIVFNPDFVYPNPANWGSDMEMNHYTGIILAGGAGKRFGGQDKGLISFKGQPLIEHALLLTQACCQTTVISANRNLALYQSYGISVVPDVDPGFQGPLSGIKACESIIQSKWTLVIACDMPHLNLPLLNRLQAELKASHCSAAVYGQNDILQCGLFAFENNRVTDLSTYLSTGNRSIKGWLREQTLLVLDEPNPVYFTNLNSPDLLTSIEPG